MKAETAVLDIQGQYRVYTEFYRADCAERTIILVNGSLSTTASFAQTLRYLHPHFNDFFHRHFNAHFARGYVCRQLLASSQALHPGRQRAIAQDGKKTTDRQSDAADKRRRLRGAHGSTKKWGATAVQGRKAAMVVQAQKYVFDSCSRFPGGA